MASRTETTCVTMIDGLMDGLRSFAGSRNTSILMDGWMDGLTALPLGCSKDALLSRVRVPVGVDGDECLFTPKTKLEGNKTN